jgi:hypothetical protein
MRTRPFFKFSEKTFFSEKGVLCGHAHHWGSAPHIGGTRHMFRYIKTHTENILVISVLVTSWAGVVTAGLYGNGFFA